MDDNMDIKVSLDEAKACFLRQSKQIEMTRDIAKTIIGAVTIFVSIVGSLTSIRGTSPSNTSLYNWVVIIAAILFIAMIGFCMKLLLPEKFFGPIDSKTKVYEDAFFDKDERTVLLKIFSGYLNAVQLNDPAIRNRNRYSVIVAGLMIGIVICMILLILIR